MNHEDATNDYYLWQIHLLQQMTVLNVLHSVYGSVKDQKQIFTIEKLQLGAFFVGLHVKSAHHNLHEPEVTDSKPKDSLCTIMKSQEKQ